MLDPNQVFGGELHPAVRHADVLTSRHSGSDLNWRQGPPEQGGPLVQHDQCPYRKARKTRARVVMEAEAGVCSVYPGNSWDFQKLEEAGRTLPGSMREECSPEASLISGLCPP